MSKSRAPSFSNADSAACSAKISAGDRIRKGLAMSHPPGDLGDDPPVGPGLAGLRQEGALARDAPLRIGDRAVLLAPGGGRQPDWAWRDGVGLGQSRRRRRRTGRRVIAASTASASGIESTGLVAMIHSALMRPSATARNMSTAFRPGLSAMAGELQKRCTRSRCAGVLDVHMGGKHVGEAADLAPAHGVGLAGYRERPRAGLADAAGRQMAVDDGVDLVGARGRTG